MIRLTLSDGWRVCEALAMSAGASQGVGCVPLRLELLKNHALGVVADGPRLDEAAQIELRRPKHGHDGRLLLVASTMIYGCHRSCREP
jgi:hypothetical protein